MEEIKSFTDDELIKEIYRRVYDKSNIIAAKIWTRNDLDISESFSDNQKDEILDYLDPDDLMDATDRDWSFIFEAINEWKKQKK